VAGLVRRDSPEARAVDAAEPPPPPLSMPLF